LDAALKALIMHTAEPGENPHELFNELLRRSRCKRLYDANGSTRPVSALAPHLEAELQHALKLRRNMDRAGVAQASSQAKRVDDECHHVVAARAPNAAAARRIIFAVGIGINGWQNGVRLNRARHRPIHTTLYYMEVNRRLRMVDISTKTDGLPTRNKRIGGELVDMAEEIENGVFP
jgi:hypothetical protein